MAETTGHPQQSATSLGFGFERNTSYAISGIPRGVVLQGLHCGIQRKCPDASWHPWTAAQGPQSLPLLSEDFFAQISCCWVYPVILTAIFPTPTYLSHTLLSHLQESLSHLSPNHRGDNCGMVKKNRFIVQFLLLFWEKHLVS